MDRPSPWSPYVCLEILSTQKSRGFDLCRGIIGALGWIGTYWVVSMSFCKSQAFWFFFIHSNNCAERIQISGNRRLQKHLWPSPELRISGNVGDKRVAIDLVIVRKALARVGGVKQWNGCAFRASSSKQDGKSCNREDFKWRSSSTLRKHGWIDVYYMETKWYKYAKWCKVHVAIEFHEENQDSSTPYK